MANKNLFPTIVGTARIRDADNNGVFFDLECATNVGASISTSETVELVCGKWESLVVEKPWSTITMTVIKTKNPDLIGKLFNVAVSSVTAGIKALTNIKVKFDENGKVEMLERSNDNLGITAVVVKSADGLTTYTLTDDYTVSVVDNRTIITRVITWDIPEGWEVLVSWSINHNAYKETIIEIVQRAKKNFTIEVFGENVDTKRMTSLLATPVTLNSEFLLEMKDMFRDGVPTWANLVFNLLDNWTLRLRDENI